MVSSGTIAPTGALVKAALGTNRRRLQGETLSTRHRIFVHEGDAVTADVAGHYREYAES